MIARHLLWMAAMTLATVAGAAESRPLLQASEQSVTFKLKDKEGKTPQIFLFRASDQAATATSVNYWRGTPNPQGGVAVEFKGVRFLRCEERPDELIVRLVGIKNELELGTRIPLDELQSGRPQRLHFGPVALGAGFITGTTDAKMLLNYDAGSRTLKIPEISGQFEWKRLFYDPQEDEGSLTDVTGEVGDLPPGGVVLKAPQE